MKKRGKNLSEHPLRHAAAVNAAGRLAEVRAAQRRRALSAKASLGAEVDALVAKEGAEELASSLRKVAAALELLDAAGMPSHRLLVLVLNDLTGVARNEILAILRALPKIKDYVRS